MDDEIDLLDLKIRRWYERNCPKRNKNINENEATIVSQDNAYADIYYEYHH